MPIQGLGNNSSLFNLNSIRTLAGGSGAANKGGGVFNLDNTGGSGGSDISNAADGNLGNLGNVNQSDPDASKALDSVAAESSLQQQFKNQLALVNLQERVQSQSRTIEILTNILKARHDASLSAARNVK